MQVYRTACLKCPSLSILFIGACGDIPRIPTQNEQPRSKPSALWESGDTYKLRARQRRKIRPSAGGPHLAPTWAGESTEHGHKQAYRQRGRSGEVSHLTLRRTDRFCGCRTCLQPQQAGPAELPKHVAPQPAQPMGSPSPPAHPALPAPLPKGPRAARLFPFC